MTEDKNIQCGVQLVDGTPCPSTIFKGMYECTNPACTVYQFWGPPGAVEPTSLPGRKDCPGCGTQYETYIYECDKCQTVHDFTPLADTKGARVV